MPENRDAHAADLFLEAVELKPGARTAFLNQACAQDTTLRARVRALIEADATLAGPGEPPADTLLGSRIRQFRIVRLLGSGGMGSVYEAVQDNPRRSVALKVMRADVVGRATLKRFEYESQILARLRHPGIAQVYEAGTHVPRGARAGEGSVSYFAMEFIDGARPITEFCDTHALPPRERLKLFVLVCDAIHHGHEKGVIHRDIKPGNILVDAAGQPKVIDFGIARAAAATGVVTVPTDTGIGELVGTLSYMSPEQSAGDPQAIDTRSDVYALGVVLHELLTGALPHYHVEPALFETPLAPSDAPSRRAAPPHPALRGDLAIIVHKALERQRDRRYASAAEFAADIGRFLRAEPIAAHAPSAMYQLRLFARRNAGLVTGLAATLTGLLVCLGVALHQTVRARDAEAQVRDFLAESVGQGYLANIAAADAAIRASDGGIAAARLQATPPALRGWEWRYLNTRADLSTQTLPLPGPNLWHGALLPGTSRVACAQNPSTTTMVDLDTGATLWKRDDFSCFPTSFSPDGTLLVGQYAEHVLICAAATGATRARVHAFPGKPANGLVACFHPDGRRIAVGDQQGRVIIWDWQTGVNEREFVVPREWIQAVRFSPDGSLLAFTTSISLCLAALDSAAPPTELPLAPGYPYEEARGVCFSPDGTLLAVSHGPVIQVWDLRSRTVQQEIRTHTQRVFDLAFSPDARLLASVSADRTLRLWDLAAAAPRETLIGHTGMVRSVSFTADATQLVTTSDDRTIKRWSVSPPADTRTILVPEGNPWGLAFLPDNRRLAYSGGGIIHLEDLAGGPSLVIPGRARWDHSFTCALSPDARTVALPNEWHGLRLFDTATGEQLWSVPDHSDPLGSIVFSPDGTRIASSAMDGIIHVRSAADGSPLLQIDSGCHVHRLCYQPRTGCLAASAVEPDGLVRLWDADGTLLRTIHDPAGLAFCIAFNADGSRLVIGTGSGVATVWDTATWQPVAELTGMQPEVWALAFSPDGTRLAIGSKDRTIHIWDTRCWRDLLDLRGPVGTVVSLAWSPDGNKLAAGSHDRTVRIWDAPALSLH